MEDRKEKKPSMDSIEQHQSESNSRKETIIRANNNLELLLSQKVNFLEQKNNSDKFLSKFEELTQTRQSLFENFNQKDIHTEEIRAYAKEMFEHAVVCCYELASPIEPYINYEKSVKDNIPLWDALDNKVTIIEEIYLKGQFPKLIKLMGKEGFPNQAVDFFQGIVKEWDFVTGKKRIVLKKSSNQTQDVKVIKTAKKLSVETLQKKIEEMRMLPSTMGSWGNLLVVMKEFLTGNISDLASLHKDKKEDLSYTQLYWYVMAQLRKIEKMYQEDRFVVSKGLKTDREIDVFTDLCADFDAHLRQQKDAIDLLYKPEKIGAIHDVWQAIKKKFRPQKVQKRK